MYNYCRTTVISNNVLAKERPSEGREASRLVQKYSVCVCMTSK